MTAGMVTYVLREETQCKRLWAFLKANWRGASLAGRPLAVSVSEHKAKRSGEQNRLYWALLRQLSESAWVDGRRCDAEAWHEYLRRRFIGLEEIQLPDGRRIERGISTATLSTSEFSEYLDNITMYAAEDLGVDLT